MQLPYTLYTTEIPVKGIGYLVLNDPDALKDGVNALLAKGATTVFARGPLEEGERDGLDILYAHDLLVMERSLAGRPAPEGRLRLEALREHEAPVYIQIHNESFFTVPNGATIDRSELDKLLRPVERAGIVWLGTRPVGIYNCILEGDVPEIDALGLIKVMRGKGLGRELLRSILDLLAAEGYGRCSLMVSTANEAAFALYRSEGFTVTEKYSTWYEVRRHA